MPRAVPPLLLLIAAIAVVPPAAAQDLPESSPQAMLHHAQGIAAYVDGRNAEAITHFTAAHAADPTSYLSLLMAGVTAGNAGQGARADSFYAVLMPNKEKLSPYYRLRFDAQLASRAGNVEGYIAANKAAAALGRGTKASYNVAQGVIQRGRAAEARDMLKQLDPDREPMKGWYSYYSVYANASHALGDFEDELQNARRARSTMAGDIRAAGLEADALASLGRVPDADKVLAEIQALPARGAVTPGQLITTAGLEFTAHGNAAAGKRWLETAVSWFNALPDSAQTTGTRGDKAYALYVLGQHKPAAEIHQALATAQTNPGVWHAWVGLDAALTGDRTRATEVAKKLEAGENSMTPPNRVLWRGLIAAGLNDGSNAARLLIESEIRARWMHRDPVLQRVLGTNATWVAHLKPVQ